MLSCGGGVAAKLPDNALQETEVTGSAGRDFVPRIHGEAGDRAVIDRRHGSRIYTISRRIKAVKHFFCGS